MRRVLRTKERVSYTWFYNARFHTGHFSFVRVNKYPFFEYLIRFRLIKNVDFRYGPPNLRRSLVRLGLGDKSLIFDG